MTFRYQVNHTDPNGWNVVDVPYLDSRRDFVTALAETLGPGSHTIYLQLGKETHPDGAPMRVSAWKIDIAVNSEGTVHLSGGLIGGQHKRPAGVAS